MRSAAKTMKHISKEKRIVEKYKIILTGWLLETEKENLFDNK